MILIIYKIQRDMFVDAEKYQSSVKKSDYSIYSFF